jgi:N utilization substance protein A
MGSVALHSILNIYYYFNMATHSDLIAAINQIAAERNIDPNDVIEAIKMAIKTGFKEDYPDEEASLIEVEINAEQGAISVYADKKIVKAVTDPKTQITITDAKKINAALKENDHVLIDITPTGDFGRVAAQSAKQVILQKIRESEKEAVMKEFNGRMGEIEYGIVQRMDGDNVIFEIRRAIAIMPLEDRIPVEFYRSGTKTKVLLKEIRMTPKGKQLIVSRSDAGFLKGLFLLEVPEIESETVEIKSIAREAGSRSKVAVYSNTDGVDPIGSCVGQKGARINAIMNELRFGNIEEKVDIILWDAEPSIFVANALSPAKVVSVEVLDAENKHARVTVPDDQFSLAIGKEGQNVRLAAKLTGWNIDIEGETIKMERREDKNAAPKAEVKAEAKVEAKEEAVAEEVKETKVEKKATKKPAVKKVAEKKVAVKKEVAKKVVKKAVEKKVVAKKAPAKKAPAKAEKKVVKKAVKKVVKKTK